MKPFTRLPSALLAVPLAATLLSAGTTPASAVTGIEAEYDGLPQAQDWLGEPTSEESCELRDKGCYREYDKGAIYWSPDTGARAQRGAIYARWRAEGSEHGPLSYPVSRETCSDGTCEVRYQRGSITWTEADGTTVHRDVDEAASAGVVVNKQRALSPQDYAPAPLRDVGGGVQLRDDAAAAYERMSRAAAEQGVELTAVSGYRDYATQVGLYEQYTSTYGRETADSISARPGHSEHQTGLAIDVGAPDGSCALLACFEDTPQGRWVADHAHEHGFVVRYPDGRTGTTGYAYEPWHLRYVGEDTATSVKNSGKPDLESYLGLPGAPSY